MADLRETNDTAGCLNCGTPAPGSYCPSCGQATHNRDLPLRELAGAWFGDLAAFDSRVLGTLRLLMTRPGALTLEFIAGRRRRWIHPVKLYLAVSLLLFLTVGLSGFSVVTVNDGANTSDKGPVNFGVQVDTKEPPPPIDIENDSAASRAPSPIAKIARLFLEDPEHFNQVFISRLAKAVFLLVPVFALLLKGLYRRSLYVHHLVFSLHQHSFAFLAILAGLLVDLAIGTQNGPGNAIAVLAIVIYTFLALRRCYPRGRLATTMAMIVVYFGYLVALLVTMTLALLATSLTI